MIAQRFFAATALGLLSACSSNEPIVVPAIGMGGAPQPGRFVWHDLITPDVGAARTFYGGLFGWTFELQADGDYSAIRHDGRTIGGLVDADQIDRGRVDALWISSISVDDVDEVVSRVLENGGVVHEAATDLANRGRVAVLGDPEGGSFAVVRSTSGDPERVDPGVGDWLWHELICVDPEAAAAFYSASMGYSLNRSETTPGDPPYLALRTEDLPQAGIVSNPFEERRGLWVPYVRVADVEASVAQTLLLGGAVVIAPDAALRDGSVALVTDPHGALIALQEWNGR